jgi:predicted small metal-binding protein
MKVFICSCGHLVHGNSEIELMRKASDHIRFAHPYSYEEMLEDLSPQQIKGWMKMHIRERVFA